jgi:DNA repair protein RadC
MKNLAPQFQIKKVNNSSFKKVKITSSSLIEKFCRQFYLDDLEIFESFFIAMLDRSNNTIGWAKISQGGVSSCIVDAKIVAKYAVESLASSIILCHNHPSGNLTPSHADIKITKKLKQGLEMLDIQVLDHIILTADSYTSLADSGLI